MLFIGLDLLAKLGYSVSLMVGNFTRTDQVLEERLTRYEDLLQTGQTQQEDDQAMHGVFAAYSEAESWRADRRARLLQAGVPEQQADVFLDAAVGEYIALAHGRLGAYGEGRQRRAREEAGTVRSHLVRCFRPAGGIAAGRH